MRISDWSSDVCSSDLRDHAVEQLLAAFFQAARVALAADSGVVDENVEIGGAAEGRVAGIQHRPDTVERTDVGLHGESLAARRRDLRHQRLEIGRASCRESVWTYG